MLGLGLGLPRIKMAGGFVDEYIAVLDRMTTLGYTLPTDATQVLQNALVKSLKTQGVWDKLELFYVFATDGDSDSATINWAAPSTFQVTRVNSPTFTSKEGFKGNGTTSYLNTGFVPNTDVTISSANSTFVGAWVSEGPTGDLDTIFQSSISSNGNLGTFFYHRTSLIAKFFVNNKGPSSILSGTGITGGNFYSGDNSLGSTSVYKNGVVENTSGNPFTLGDANLVILSGWFSSPFRHADAEVSVFAYGASIGADAEHTAMYNSLNTYLTSI